jgi:hypothetical protein
MLRSSHVRSIVLGLAVASAFIFAPPPRHREAPVSSARSFAKRLPVHRAR